MTYRVRTAFILPSLLLWWHGYGRLCLQDECTDVAEAMLIAEEAESMLQKNTKKTKLDTSSSIPAALMCDPVAQDRNCTVMLLDSTSLSGMCMLAQDGVAGFCSTTPVNGCPPQEEGKSCEYAGFSGVCVKNENFNLPNQPLYCDVWSADVSPPATTTTTTTTQTAPVVLACPSSCRSPTCYKGAQHNGGLPLVDGKCQHFCSKPFGGLRYCGTGSAYTTGDNVDCGGCGADPYVHAPDGSSSCPAGYTHIRDAEECKAGVAIAGTQYTWSGRMECNWRWPAAGCFTFGSKLYFSTCSADLPLSQYSHDSVCKKSTVEVATTTTTTTTAASVGGCPATCQSPACLKGGHYNGGLPLSDGKCLHRCSQEYSAVRYCGVGDAYNAGDSVDCSGCATGKYIPAVEGSMSCPVRYVPIVDPEECKAIASDYPATWSGRSDCSWLWPAGGCFAYGDKLYFSLCSKERPLSQHDHLGICKKVSN